MSTVSRTDPVLVWDLPTRLFHWGLALCVVGSWATAEGGFEWTEAHFLFGYTALGFVAFRLVWGFVGPEQARFGTFLKGPSAVASYARRLLSREPEAQAGHTPLGGWMALALVVCVGVQACLGLFIADDIFYAGPYNSVVTTDTARTLAGLHHLNFDVLAVLVLLHVGAVIWYRVRKGQNLAAAMITGRKRDVQPDPDHRPTDERRMLITALLIAVCVAVLVTALVQLAPPPPVMDFM